MVIEGWIYIKFDCCLCKNPTGDFAFYPEKNFIEIMDQVMDFKKKQFCKRCWDRMENDE